MTMTDECLKQYLEIEQTWGEINRDGLISSHYSKFGNFPWYLVSWYNEGGADGHCGSVDDSGYYARFEVAVSEAKYYNIPSDVVGYIVREDSFGRVTYEEYNLASTFNEHWAKIERDYEAYYADDEESEVAREIQEQLDAIQEEIQANNGRCTQCDSSTVRFGNVTRFVHEHHCFNQQKINQLENRLQELEA